MWLAYLCHMYFVLSVFKRTIVLDLVTVCVITSNVLAIIETP